MSKSIMEPKGAYQCWNCGDTRNLEVHHIFFGVRARKKSEQYGQKVHLCPACHRYAKTGVHGGNKELDLSLKQEAEKLFEQKYGRELFRQEFGRFYTDENAENMNQGFDFSGVQWI